MIFFWFSIEDWPRIFYRSIDLSSIECNNTLFVAICGRKGSQNCTRKIFVKLIQLYKRVIQILPGLKIVLSRQVIYIRHTSYVYYPVIKICANNWKNISIRTLFITIKNFYWDVLYLFHLGIIRNLTFRLFNLASYRKQTNSFEAKYQWINLPIISLARIDQCPRPPPIVHHVSL